MDFVCIFLVSNNNGKIHCSEINWCLNNGYLMLRHQQTVQGTVPWKNQP